MGNFIQFEREAAIAAANGRKSGHVRQNFSHGRSKSVVVEKKKTRRLGSEGEGTAPPAPSAVTIEKSQAPHVPPAPPSRTSAIPFRWPRPSNVERAARERALLQPAPKTSSRTPEVEPVRFEPVARPPEPQPRAEERPPTAPSEQPAVAARAAPAPEQAARRYQLRQQPPPQLRFQLRRRRLPDVGRAMKAAAMVDVRAVATLGHAPRGDGGRPHQPRPTSVGQHLAFMPREASRPREIEAADAGPPWRVRRTSRCDDD
ncbi:translation initiation factor IF-2 associated domain-containing protein [Bradyrhizobium sp. RDI18]|uniref:translation initiation factor IF-2 associated domain-containing protein n=1 Tax=Bradyrhizobium sp. RDI18 TaxID=3367400 RepID=UPI0037223112